MARRLGRALRRGPALTLVTVAGIVVGLVLFFELGGPSAEVVDRVGIVDAWTIGRADAAAAALAVPAPRTLAELGARGVAIAGPEGHVVEAYWLGRPCDTASRVTVEGSPGAIRLLVERRDGRWIRGGCDDSGEVYRLTLVGSRLLAPGSVSGEVVAEG